jgi:predicted nuclease of predicted toxin-antitoxin system
MRLLVDMNLSPDWVPLLKSRDWEAVHGSSLGRGNEPDPDLLAWARANNHIVLTQDLDFSQILYATAESGPSVVLLRMDNEFDPAARRYICAALNQAEEALTHGALLTISPKRARLRRLPIIPSE